MPTAQILWPRPSLAGCIFATIVRDTRGTSLAHHDRFNHFPAGPFCGVTVFLAGVSHRITTREQIETPAAAPLFPAYTFSGPQKCPTLSWNPGPVFAATVVFYPDAFTALSGLDASDLADCVRDAEGVLPDGLLDLFGTFQSAACQQPVHRSFRSFEDGLEALWDRTRPKGHSVSAWLQDWGRAVVARAAVSSAGRSARQMERRIKSWTGLTERDLEGFGRGEHLLARVRSAQTASDFSWARLATEAGFADQSHMTRRVRRDTGLPPEQLIRAITTHESFWCYRLLGERY
jgi:AraC-like DNA-binding protein